MNGVDELKNIIQPDAAEDILSNLSKLCGFSYHFWFIITMGVRDSLGGFIPGITADSNANVLEMGLEVAQSFFDVAPFTICDNIAGDTVSNVVEKAFGGRPSTQTKGKRLILKVMEVSNVTTCSTILLSKFSDRRPKIPPMCIDIITEAIGLYGIGLFPIKEIVKGLPGVFNGNNSGAREAAMKLIIEIHRWVGMAPIQSLVDELRSAQKAEFEKILGEKASEQSAGPPVPSLYTKKDRLALESGAPITQNQRSIDARAFCEEIDLSKKLKGTEFSELVASEKWSDQSNALQLLQKLMGPTPVLKYNSSVHDIIGMCHTFLKQGHVQVQLLSLRVLGVIAESLKDKVNADLRPLLVTVLGRTKEKKIIVDLLDAMKKMFQHSLQFDSFAPDAAEILKGKNPPHAKICIIELLEFIIQAAIPCNGETSSIMVNNLLQCCEDSDPKVRESSVKALRAMASASKATDRRTDAFKVALKSLQSSSPKLYAKITASNDEEVSAPLPQSVPKAVVSSSSDSVEPAVVGNSKILSRSENNAATSAPTTASRTKILGASSVKAASQTNAKKASSASVEEDDTVDESLMNIDQATEVLQSVMSDVNWDSFMAKFNSAKWQDKQEAFCDIQNRVPNDRREDGLLLSALVCFTSKQTNGFKISNIMVLKAAIDTFCKAATISAFDKYTKSAAWELLNQFSEKLSDKKVSASVEAMLSILCDLCNGNLIIKRVCTLVEASKAPTTHQAFLQWLKQRISQNGLVQLPVAAVVPFCMKEIEHKLANVRSSSVEVLGEMYSKCGPKLLSIIRMDDLPPQVKQVLETEFQRVGFDPTTVQASMNEGGADLFPRKDILSMLEKGILKEMNFTEGKNSWQNRKKALDNVIAACESSGHYLEYNKATGELVKSVKLRINDTQSNLKPVAMSALGHLIASFPPESGPKVLRAIAGSMLSGLTDNKRPMREATIGSLQLAVTKNSETSDPDLFMAIFPSLSEALGNTIGRQELLEWMSLHKQDFRGDCSELAPVLLLVLMDKLAPVRLLSEQLLTFFLSQGLISKNSIEKVARDLAPASKRAIQGSLDRLAMVDGPLKSHAQHTDIAASRPATQPIVHPSPPQLSIEDNSNNNQISSNVVPQPGFLAIDSKMTLSWPQPPKEPSYNDLLVLKSLWSDGMTGGLNELLFPNVNRFDIFNQDVFLSAMDALSNLLSSPYFEQHVSFVFAWMSYVLYTQESNQGMVCLLDFIKLTFSYIMETHNRKLITNADFTIIVPHLIEVLGSRYEKYGSSIANIVTMTNNILSPDACFRVFSCGLKSSNKRSYFFCLDEIKGLVESNADKISWSRLDLVDLGSFLALHLGDSVALSASVQIIKSIYGASGLSPSQFLSKLGPFSEQIKSLLDKDVFQRSMSRQSSSQALTPRQESKEHSKIVVEIRDDSPLAITLQIFLRSGEEKDDFSLVRNVLSEQLKIFIAKLDGGVEDADINLIGDFCDCLRLIVNRRSDAQKLDFPLLILLLTAIFQLLSRGMATLALTKRCITACMECGNRIAQDSYSTSSVDIPDGKQSISRALHIILVTLLKPFSIHTILSVLFDVSIEQRLPSSTTNQAITRMVDKFIRNRSKNGSVGELQEESKGLLLHLHRISTSTPISSAPALHILRKAVSLAVEDYGRDFVQNWIESSQIASDALICVILDRLTTPDDRNHERIVALIDQITSSTSKIEPVTELFRIKKLNPHIEVNNYLSKLSVPFRNFVLETWQNLENDPMKKFSQAEEVEPACVDDGANNNRKYHLESASQAAGTEGATEAMRILEGLKSRPSHFTRMTKSSVANAPSTDDSAVDPATNGLVFLSSLLFWFFLLTFTAISRPPSISRTGSSPFARRNEKIRDSLSTLSASLDLPTTLRGRPIQICGDIHRF